MSAGKLVSPAKQRNTDSSMKRRKVADEDEAIQSTLSQTQPVIKNVVQKKNALDFNFLFSEMMLDEKEQNLSSRAENKPFHSFQKTKHLNIKDLQSKSKHIVHNKVSDKLSRRDVHYYDLYALQDPAEDYHLMREEGYPHTKHDAKIKELYGDLAYPDFN